MLNFKHHNEKVKLLEKLTNHHRQLSSLVSCSISVSRVTKDDFTGSVISSANDEYANRNEIFAIVSIVRLIPIQM